MSSDITPILKGDNEDDTTPLLHGDNDDDVSIDICGNSPAPPLTPGKLYHVFFSYTQSDTDLARSLIQRLETELGYKCCDHQRDFVPGISVVTNIQNSIERSLKTVVLISKESVRSPWCSYEAEFMFHMSLEMRKKMVIPILVDCCTIPGHLKHLTYIDARKDPTNRSWWPQLVNATIQSGTLYNKKLFINNLLTQGYCRPRLIKIVVRTWAGMFVIGDYIYLVDQVPIFESDLSSLSSQPYTSNPTVNNFEHLVTMNSKQSTCMGEKIPTNSIHYELFYQGIQVPFSVFREEMNNLNKQLVFRFHCCCFCRLCWIPWVVAACCIGIVGLLFLFHGIVTTCVSAMHSNFDVCIAEIVSAVLITIFVFSFILSFVFLTILRKKRELQLFKLVSQINQRMIPYQIMMTCRSHSCSRGFEIDFVYYNYQPCLDHISSTMMVSLSQASEESVSEEDIVIEDAAKNTLTKHSCLYLRQYLDDKLPHPSEPRHTSNTLCLCQFVENLSPEIACTST